MANGSNGRGVIFDMDGVLVDTGEFHKQSWRDIGLEVGFEMSDEFFAQTFGMQNYLIVPILMGDDISAEEVQRISDMKESRYRQLSAGKLGLTEGAEELIVGLRASGFRLAVGSSTPRANLNAILEQIHIQDYFNALVAGEDVRHGKPAPDTFLAAAEKLNLPPGCCVVVEDAAAGVEAAVAGGMSVIGITTSLPRVKLNKANLIIDSLTELNPSDFAKLLEQ